MWNKQEQEYDRKLSIQTCGRDDSYENRYQHPYEPTPYCVLERLVQEGWIHKHNVVLDYGCGKGRVDFFLSHVVSCRSIGIECMELFYEQAMSNQLMATSKNLVTFHHIDAQDYVIDLDVDCIFFFNPFSVEILQRVMQRILESYYQRPRCIRLFFYYPSDAYIYYLMGLEELLCIDEIDCCDLFHTKDIRERILIFEL